MTLTSLLGILLWLIFFSLATGFAWLCIASLLIAPVRVFFVLRFVLGQKKWVAAKVFFSCFALLLLLGAFGILTRGGIYFSRPDYRPRFLLYDVLFDPRQGLAWLAFEFSFRHFKSWAAARTLPQGPAPASP